MKPTRPTVSDVVSRTSRRDLGSGLRLVMTWTDCRCGCSWSDRGSWIVSSVCHFGHVALLPRGALRRLRKGELYGPFVPQPRPARPHAEAPAEAGTAGEGATGALPSPAASALTLTHV